ncbi:MAG: L-seryl-tRNA(Sec) selenium transferase, partial [Solirubrobacteraceae bacterium]
GDGAREATALVERARRRLRPSLRRVLNGTGVVIHTNLGRAPLSEAAVAAVSEAARGYANVELELDSGERGSRHEHVRLLLRELTGAQDALVVNNGAGAALLALAALAAGEPVAVSRGQLVEIGGGFRIPDVLAQAGVPLIEVGTTNRTRIADYERAISEAGAATILRVHQSNFRTLGFVEEVAIERLCALGVPVIDDVGSGALAERLPALADEPSVRRSLAAGASLLCFSGDKLLGGPQAGILLGGSEAIAACRRHPLARALRIGRLPLAALAATLALYRDPERALREVPVLSMLNLDRDTLDARARRLSEGCGAVEAEIVEAVARVGGGALPLLELRGPALALGPASTDPQALAAALRGGDPPLVPRISRGRVLVDPRTLAEDEIDRAASAIRAVLA